MIAVAVAVAAAIEGFHRDLMLAVAAGIAALLSIPALVLLFRQAQDRRRVPPQDIDQPGVLLKRVDTPGRVLEGTGVSPPSGS